MAAMLILLYLAARDVRKVQKTIPDGITIIR